MNNLIYVIYNLKLKNKHIQKISAFPFDDIEFDDEWIIEKGDHVEFEQI